MPNWKPIQAFPRYLVSDNGQIRSLVRGNAKLLKPSKKTNGYLQVTLFTNNRRYYVHIARIVGETFIGPRPFGYQINHKDGDKENNNASNLEWVTPSENIKHAYRFGLLQSHAGERHPLAKLNFAKVRRIREMASKGFKLKDIAKKYEVNPSCISAICSWHRWNYAEAA